MLELEVGKLDDHLNDVADQLLAGPYLLGFLDCRLEEENFAVFGLVCEE